MKFLSLHEKNDGGNYDFTLMYDPSMQIEQIDLFPREPTFVHDINVVDYKELCKNLINKGDGNQVPL